MRKMTNIVYRCPTTGVKVGCRMEDLPKQDKNTHSYRATLCPACTRLHFVHRITGKVLGSDDEP